MMFGSGGVIITARCEIGNGAVVAGGAVVTRSVPPYAIVGGNPAKIIGWRFDEDVQRKLEEIQWYNWTVEKVEENKKMLTDMVGFSIENYTFNYCKRKKEMTRIGHQ